MNDFFLDLGFSWAWSKALPYLVSIVFGITVFLMFRSKLKARWAKILLLLVIPLPFALHFAIYPIYEGDFSNNYSTQKASPVFRFNKNELTVIAIPNCPFCAESIERLNKIVERTDVKRINFIVITDQEEALIYYKGLAKKEIIVSAIPDFDLLNIISRGRFPTFVYSDGGEFHVWHNDGFGVRALDWVEQQMEDAMDKK